MRSLEEHEVYELVSITRVSKGQKTMGSGFVFKRISDGRFKARGQLVVQGHPQKPGIEDGRLFLPMCHIESQRVLLETAYEHGRPVYKLDKHVACLQSKIEDDVFVKLSPEHERTDPNTEVFKVIKLQRSLYGLSQSSALPWATINTALPGTDFTTTASNPCVYTHGRNNTLANLTLHVDNILRSVRNKELMKRVKKAFIGRLAMTGGRG